MTDIDKSPKANFFSFTDLFFSGLFMAYLLCSSSAFAQRVQPMVYELTPSGSGASTSLRIENSKSTPMTLEFVASKIVLTEDGIETNISAEDDFLIFPPQALIKSGKTQVIRVKYIGDPLLETSQAYRISIKQLPVTLDRSSSTGVAMLVNFHTLANVIPKSSKADLAVTSIEPISDSKWLVTVENTGNRFARLSKTEWLIRSTTDTKKELKLSRTEVGEMTDLNLVLPNSKLRQLIPAIEGFDPSATAITINAG